MSNVTTREWITTGVLALVAAGGAFFGANWGAGYEPAFQAAGTTFFATTGALLVALGVDPRRKV